MCVMMRHERGNRDHAMTGNGDFADGFSRVARIDD
jgi:hypothetical protein